MTWPQIRGRAPPSTSACSAYPKRFSSAATAASPARSPAPSPTTSWPTTSRGCWRRRRALPARQAGGHDVFELGLELGVAGHDLLEVGLGERQKRHRRLGLHG